MRHSPVSYWHALWVRSLLGLALAFVIVFVGYVQAGGLDGGLDGPCVGEGQFSRSVPEGSPRRGEYTPWPPGLRCEADLATGETRVARYPTDGTWLLAALAFAGSVILPTPFLRRLRRRRQGSEVRA